MPTAKQITIVVEKVDEDRMQVVVSCNGDLDFGTMICATEYMMAITAAKSNLGFEAALEKLIEGATTYKTVHHQEADDADG